jgi:hypothetical protein
VRQGSGSLDNRSRVLAEPTKGFFVSMLVRDIELIPAIVDLVDNSVDGARRLRGSGRFDGLWVRLDISSDAFRIADNCGGIPIETARRYAFRFGRPVDAPSLARSVGQFGVGMKRALFKLGSKFRIESVERSSDFVLSVDVDEWTRQPDWDFSFEEFHEDVVHPEDDTGAEIHVLNLHDEVAADFALDDFLPQLASEIEHKHNESLSRGLAVSLNGIPVTSEPLTLLQSDAIRPAFRRVTYNGHRPAVVEARLFSGVSRSAPQEAGWYIYCNGRLILGPDRTELTVWGAGRGRQIPSFHTQFSRFRGYAFFESDDAAQLPWTTTKVGVDGNSPIWRSARRELLSLTRPVIDFLNAIDWERPALAGEHVEMLEDLVNRAIPTRLDQIQPSDRFVAPERTRLEAPPSTSSIQYRRLVTSIEKAKRLLGVTTNREVGERTFEYFLEAEGDEE